MGEKSLNKAALDEAHEYGASATTRLVPINLVGTRATDSNTRNQSRAGQHQNVISSPPNYAPWISFTSKPKALCQAFEQVEARNEVAPIAIDLEIRDATSEMNEAEEQAAPMSALLEAKPILGDSEVETSLIITDFHLFPKLPTELRLKVW